MTEKIFFLLIFLLPSALSQDRIICEGVADFEYVASHHDCYTYYQCISGIAYRLQCPRGNFFSTERQTCVPYYESDCPLLNPTTTPPATTTTPGDGLPTCSDVPEFGYIPSLQACDYYYQCIEGTQYLLKCPRGLYFSFAQQNCVNPTDSDCPLISTSPAPPTTTAPANGLPTCRDVPEFGYIPSLQACDYYYQCIEGTQYLLKCPRGLYFSFAQQNCVNPTDSDCPLISTTPALPTTTPPPGGPPTCADVPEFGYIPSLQACDYYYQCIEGTQYLLKCPRGLYFSFAEQNCVNPTDSDCPLISTTPPAPTTTAPANGLPTCRDVPEFGYIPSMQACDYYYQCIEGTEYLLKCPRGLYFSFAEQNCVNPTDSDCPLIGTTPSPPTTPPSGPPTCADVPEFGYIPSLQACDYYYQCIEGDQYLLKCPRGFYFTFSIQSCGNPSTSDCPLLSTTPAAKVINDESEQT
ncbi:uncharacterized protein [Chironomus tepperi]|uniref:uncharacterized protein n=1 Tax=Chironomus tepperi TaxID=113505 RepID=UPI00391FAEA5